MFVESSLDQPKSDVYVNVCAAQYVNFCVRGAVRQSGVEGSVCGGGGGSLAEEELRSPRKPLLHLTHAMLGVSLPPSEPSSSSNISPFGSLRLVKEKINLFL